jgi:hypothetical protein
MDKTFSIVGISTQGKDTKFRVANGDINQRIKVLERNGHTAINLISLPSALPKMEAIAEFQRLHPEAATVRLPNQGDDTKTVKAKTVSLRSGGNRSIMDAANELLRAVEEA